MAKFSDKSVTIFIPAYNEVEILEDTSRRVHEYLESRGLEHEVMIVDNGSDDGSAELGKRLMETQPWLRFFSLPEKGPGRAFSYGVAQAKGDYIITLDADLSSELTFIDFAVHLLTYGDVVVGSKTMGNQRRTLLRVFCSQSYILFTQWFFDLTVSDFSIGTKAFRRELLVNTLPYLDHWTAHIFELCVFFKLKGKRIIQVGINCDDNRKSHFNLLHEGFYRYSQLMKCWKKLQDKESWFYFLDCKP